MHELFDHTADLGLKIRAESLDALFAEAALALSEALVEDPRAIEPSTEERFVLEAERLDDLLHDWLAELLYAFDARRMLFGQFGARVSPPRLEAVALGERFDARCHRLKTEIKAVTYHALRVERIGDGWLAEVVLDI